jgi:hypothetical protein
MMQANARGRFTANCPGSHPSSISIIRELRRNLLHARRRGDMLRW